MSVNKKYLGLTLILGHYLTKVEFLIIFFKITEYSVEILKVSGHAEYQ